MDYNKPAIYCKFHKKLALHWVVVWDEIHVLCVIAAELHFGQNDTLARDTLDGTLWPEWHFGQSDISTRRFMAFMEKAYGNNINIKLYWTIFFQMNLCAAVAMAFQNYNHKTRWFSSLLYCSPQYIQQACNTLKSVSNKFFVISLPFFAFIAQRITTT